MNPYTKDLRIVVLESPYDTWEDPRVPKVYSDMVDLKLRGYGCEHPYGILPVDGADLISTHLLLCRTIDRDQLTPVMGIRFTSHVKCRSHYMSFPGLTLVQQAGSLDHIDAVETIIANADKRGAALYYCGALSIAPTERGDKERARIYRELLTTMYVGYLEDNKPAELIAGGTLRFKIDKWLDSIGHKPIQKNGSILGPINVRHLAGETVQVMHSDAFSLEARQLHRKWRGMWNDRLSILTKDVVQVIKRKAG